MRKFWRHLPALAAAGLVALGAAGCAYPEMPQNNFAAEQLKRDYESGKIDYNTYVRTMETFDPNFKPPPTGREPPHPATNSGVRYYDPPPQPGR